MALSFKTTTANSILDNAYDTLYGASPICEIRTGAAPGPDSAAAGTLLAAVVAPATAFSAAAARTKAKTGTWSVAAAGTGTAAHFRFKNAGDTVREEGTVALSAADMTLDNLSITTGQTVTIVTFTRTLP